MTKHKNEDAFYARMNELAQSKKPSVKESRTIGTLVDVKRTVDGVGYGIIKEQHQYYIKKGGLKKNLNASDFAYIGGLSNITEHQYSTLAVADKNRNFMLATINESLSRKMSKTGSKKSMLTEDKAGKEIGDAEAALPGLEAATDAAAVPAEPVPAPVGDDGAAEMDAGVDAMPADGEMPMDDPLAGAEGGEEMPGEEGSEDEGSTPLQKQVAGIAKEIQNADLEKGESKWLLDRFLRAFLPVAGVSEGEKSLAGMSGGEMGALPQKEKSLAGMSGGEMAALGQKNEGDEALPPEAPAPEAVAPEAVAAEAPAPEEDNKMADLEIEDRQELADMILNVVPDEDIESLGKNVEDTDGDGVPDEPEIPMEEECSECGGFAQYAESRGYTAKSIQECGEEEMTNLVSGFANGHEEGENDGDFKVVALIVTPEILEKLKSEYGHDEFASEVEPFANEMNETSAEDKEAQINELFGGLKHLANKAGQGIKQGAQAVGQGIKQAGQDVAQGVQQAATNVKQTYHAGEKNAALSKLEKVAANLGQQIASVNKHAEKSGEEPINVKSILATISNQVGSAAGAADLGKFRTNEDGVKTGHVEVMPPTIEEDVTLKVGEKKGKALSAEKAPEVEMKEGEEPEGDDIDVAPEGDDVLDLTKREEPEMTMKTGFEPMGGGIVKPDGAEVTTVEVTKDSVTVEMNENEVKLRKYIRNRLEESAGLRKVKLNEDEKSKGLQKLDRIINKQFKLHEAITLDKIDNMDEAFGFGVKERFAKLDPNDEQGVNKLFQQAFNKILINPQMAAIGRAAQDTPTPEKYEILNQYIQQGGGTLRLKPKASIEDLTPNTIEFAGADVQKDATPSRFTHGGTQGKTQLGGI